MSSCRIKELGGQDDGQAVHGEIPPVRSLAKEAPNVVTETEFRNLMRCGYHAEVVCNGGTEARSSVWYGNWIIRAVSPDGREEKTLVPARKRENRIMFREFKTASAIISFLSALGCRAVTIPLDAGMRATHIIPQEDSDRTE